VLAILHGPLVNCPTPHLAGGGGPTTGANRGFRSRSADGRPVTPPATRSPAVAGKLPTSWEGFRELQIVPVADKSGRAGELDFRRPCLSLHYNTFGSGVTWNAVVPLYRNRGWLAVRGHLLERLSWHHPSPTSIAAMRTTFARPRPVCLSRGGDEIRPPALSAACLVRTGLQGGRPDPFVPGLGQQHDKVGGNLRTSSLRRRRRTRRLGLGTAGREGLSANAGLPSTFHIDNAIGAFGPTAFSQTLLQRTTRPDCEKIHRDHGGGGCRPAT